MNANVKGRRKFLQQTLIGAASLAIEGSGFAVPRASASPLGVDHPALTPPQDETLTTDRPGADFMVDVIKSLDFEYVCSNPGSSLRGLHESLINYGGNRAPEFITCCHEESAVALAHGYFKIAGKPLCVMAYGSVGLMHASMAIYNAYCDRVPVYLILGNTSDATERRPGADWDHSVLDPAAMVRDYVKWDDLPVSLPHFAESAVRAYRIAMTPPMMPVILVADSELQEKPVPEQFDSRIPKLSLTSAPEGDSGAVAEAARLLIGAANPLIVADRAARTERGMIRLVELAELLQAPVIDQGGRMNFPSRHPLNSSERRRELIANADVILGLELTDFWGTIHSFKDQLHRSSSLSIRSDAKLISISTVDLYSKSNYQDMQRYTAVDVGIGADAEATLPSLTEQLRKQLTSNRKATFQARGAKLSAERLKDIEKARIEASYAWDASPVTLPRLCAELWTQIKNDDWSLVSFVGPVGGFPMGGWPLRLWSFDKYYQFIGGSGASGIGYNAPASIGAALANKKHGRLSINIQTDGDLMYAPGVLWTAAHHRIPLLTVMHNNRAYQSEVIHVQRMCNQHNRGIQNAGIGTTLTDPNIDFAKLGRAMGIYSEGPIDSPGELNSAIRRAIDVVKRGEPALIDVFTQPR